MSVVVVDRSVPKSYAIGLVGNGRTTLHQSQMVSISCTKRVGDKDMCCSRCTRMGDRSDTREPLIYPAGQLNSTITNSDSIINLLLCFVKLLLYYAALVHVYISVKYWIQSYNIEDCMGCYNYIINMEM